MNNNKLKQSGVSLIEVLVSAVLISMVFLWISDTHMQSLTDVADSSHRNKTTWLAEEMVERIKANPVLDSYRSEINGVSNISSYCRSRQNCLNSQCSGSTMVKYDVQQVFCNNLEGLGNLRMRFDCFDIVTGSSFSPCAKRGLLRGRVTASWDSKNPSGGRLSTYSDVLFVINQSIRFDGNNDQLTVTGSLFSGDFTIGMWVRPERTSSYNGFFGRHDGSTPSRSPSLWVSPGGGLHFDSYATREETRSTTNCWKTFWGQTQCNTNTWTVTLVDRYDGNINNFFSTNTWTHVTWVKKGSQYLIYRNGIHRHTRSGIPDNIHTKSQTSVGKVDNYFRGELDDIQVYDSVLSVSQIGAIMRGHRFPDKKLSLHIDFDGDTFLDAIKDKSGYNRGVAAYNGVNENSLRHAIR